MEYQGQPTRKATAAEAKALAHPVRIRILQVLRGESKTNKEIAETLGTSPGATLHHVNVLIGQDFMKAQEERTGRRGSREVPYEATGKTRILSFEDGSALSTDVRNAILQSALESFTATPIEARFGEWSVTLNLTPERLSAVQQRIQEVINEYAHDPLTPSSEKYGFFGAGYRHPKQS